MPTLNSPQEKLRRIIVKNAISITRTIHNRVLFSITSFLLLTTGMLSAQAAQNTKATTDHSGWVQIPGKLIRPDCVHEIPNGAKVETENGQITGDVTLKGKLIAHYDACSEEAVSTRHPAANANLGHAPAGNGWVEASQWDDWGQNIDLLYGYWTVPSYPKQNGGLIYLFNGIEPSSQNWILQPVLQYGVGYAGGGNYWAIASWLVGNNYAFHSPLETVYPGNTLFGFTEVTGTSGSTLDWEVEAYDETTGAYSWITASSWGLHWSWGYAAVLEAYNITSCKQFPANLRDTFWYNEVYQGPPGYNLTNPGGAHPIHTGKLGLFRRFVVAFQHVGETSRIVQKRKIELADRPIALFRNDDFSPALKIWVVLFINLLPEDEHDYVGVLLNRSRFAQIGKLRPMVAATAFGSAAKLRQSDERDAEFFGDGFQSP